ncbi:MAG: hypothetical protein WC713_12420 [Candidatus Methylomirabilota bacterium]
MVSTLLRLACPDPPRRIPHERVINILLRTAHILTSGILLGGHVFAIPSPRLEGLLLATVVSGAGLIGLELFRSCRFVYLGQGAMVWLKLLLVLAAGIWWAQRVPLLSAATVIASVGSHMSSRYRHYSLRDGRVVE